MPKDGSRNADQFKIRGGQINDFEFNKRQRAGRQNAHDFAKQDEERQTREGETPAAPQTEAERIKQLMADVREKVQRKKRKKAAPPQPQPVATQKIGSGAAELEATKSVAGKNTVAAKQPAARKKTAGEKSTARKSES
ncbi:MAG: hypothetical protein H0T92_21560 [Pyrinomonadaceae bacterium]|nr:hypothetical protein [Pyrinomonadaceae bacterium]